VYKYFRILNKMLTRRLTVLGYHHPKDFDINNEKELRNLILWLEDKKIRYYTIDDREPLRDIESRFWVGALKKYLKDVNCPVENLNHKKSIITWLLSLAIQLEYKENAATYSTSQQQKSKHVESSVSSDEFLQSISSEEPSFKTGVECLQKLLRIPYHPDHTVILQAIAELVKQRLSDEAIETFNKNKKDKKTKEEYLPLNDTSLGFNTNDKGVNEAAKIIRLLHIQNLRQLQTHINQAIVKVQQHSANPKTDQSLGKVGR